MGKASTRAQNKYIAKAYDRVNLTLPKGRKAEIQTAADAQGESLNGFITTAINDRMAEFDGAHARASAELQEGANDDAGI